MTAKEFLEKNNRLNDSSTELLMIEFAKYHVEQALEAASEKVIIEGHPFEYELDKDSILNAYPLENIK